jgi:hypothetical protein
VFRTLAPPLRRLIPNNRRLVLVQRCVQLLKQTVLWVPWKAPLYTRKRLLILSAFPMFVPSLSW